MFPCTSTYLRHLLSINESINESIKLSSVRELRNSNENCTLVVFLTWALARGSPLRSWLLLSSASFSGSTLFFNIRMRLFHWRNPNTSRAMEIKQNRNANIIFNEKSPPLWAQIDFKKCTPHARYILLRGNYPSLTIIKFELTAKPSSDYTLSILSILFYRC